MATKKQLGLGYAALKSPVNDYLSTNERMNRVTAEFLKIDLQTALTFLTIARQTGDMTRQQRNRQAARKAYDTVVKLMNRVKLTDEDARNCGTRTGAAED